MMWTPSFLSEVVTDWNLWPVTLLNGSGTSYQVTPKDTKTHLRAKLWQRSEICIIAFPRDPELSNRRVQKMTEDVRHIEKVKYMAAALLQCPAIHLQAAQLLLCVKRSPILPTTTVTTTEPQQMKKYFPFKSESSPWPEMKPCVCGAVGGFHTSHTSRQSVQSQSTYKEANKHQHRGTRPARLSQVIGVRFGGAKLDVAACNSVEHERQNVSFWACLFTSYSTKK